MIKGCQQTWRGFFVHAARNCSSQNSLLKLPFRYAFLISSVFSCIMLRRSVCKQILAQSPLAFQSAARFLLQLSYYLLSSMSPCFHFAKNGIFVVFIYLSFAWLVVSLICSKRCQRQQLHLVCNVALYVLHESHFTPWTRSSQDVVWAKDSPFRNTRAW